jgi:hydroxymethylpyrimidine/phosphomethylpyrimidine kinase
VKAVLTIAGSDSGGGAGVQADLHTFSAHGLHGTSAITAVTAQNTQGVIAWSPVDPALVAAQIDAVASDLPLAAAKTGMLATVAVIEAVAAAVRRHRIGPLVVDPVMVARSGDRLLDPRAERAFVEMIFPLADVLTPNALEAEVLLGRPVRDAEGMRLAARDLRAMGPRSVLVKGGGISASPVALDVLDGADGFLELAVPRVDTPNTHGTGCTLSAAIASRLALGESVVDAVRGAKAYLTEALQASYSVGRGRGCPRPHPAIAPRTPIG